MAETRVIITAEANQAIQEFSRLRAEASGALNQIGRGGGQLDSVGMSARATAAALRQVPAQFTDIVVSLQAGQNPLTVLLQQGGQLRDMFGSTGAAARALGGYAIGLINPYTVLAAAAAAVALAYYQGSKEGDAYTKAIVMSGNAAGVSKGQLADMAREIGKGSNTQGAAAAALAELVGTGKVARDNLQAFALTAVNAQKSIGAAVSDTAKDFQELGKSPLQATERLNERYNYLTASVYEQIRALERRGDVDAAADIAQKAYASAMDSRASALKANLGTLESAWDWVATKSRKAWDSMLDIGREDTLTQKIDKVKKQIQGIDLEQMSFVGSSKENKAESNVRKQALKDQLEGLEKTQRDQDRVNAAKAVENNLEQAKIKWLQDGEKYLSRQQQLQDAVTKARTEGAAAGKSELEINTRVAQVTQSYSDIANDSINAQIEAIKRRGATEDSVARRSMDLLVSKHNVGLVNEQDYISAVAQMDNAAFEKEKGRLAEELALTAKKQNSQKDQAALRGQIDQVSADQATRALKAEDELFELEVRNTRAAADNYANAFDKQQAATRQGAEQLTAQRDFNAQIGLTKSGIAELAAARLEDRAAIAEQNAGIADGLDFSGKLSEQYRQQAKDLRDLAAAQREGAAKSAISDKFSPKDLEDFLDPAKAKSFGESLKDAFGGAGDALTKLRTSLDDYGIAQQTIERARAAAAVAFAGDADKLASANATIARKEAQARVGAYGDMAGAAKGFFKENTAGYKVLQGAEKAFRAMELAMAIENAVAKSGLLSSFTGLFVASKATETAADTTATGTSVVNSGVRAAADGVAAFAKTLASIPFPFNIAAGAAVVALLAGMGVAISGGGGGIDVSKQRQETQGTGSVFGDSSAKSDSIARSIELAATNSSIELTHTAGMLASLKAIENSIGGLGNLLVRGSGLTGEVSGGSKSAAENLVNNDTFQLAFGGVIGLAFSKLDQALGGFGGKLASSIFGGKVTALDTGITANAASLAAIMSGGLNAQQYTDIKKSGGLFHSDKYDSPKTDLGAEANDQFAKVILGLSNSVKTAAELLGAGGDEFTERLNSFVVDIGKISLKDMDGEEIQAALEAVFSKVGDDMARFAVDGLESFQKVGEGYFETLTRIATDYANVDSILESLGGSFGQTGMASIEARERLIDLNGGIDELASQTSSFADNFLTEAERLAPVQKYVTEQLAAMGLQSLDTSEKFKEYTLELVNSGALATEAGAQRYADLMALQEAYAKTHAANVDLTKSEQAIADERKDLQDQYDDLTMSAAQLAEKARAAIDSHNLALYDQVQAAQAAAAAADAVTEAQSGLLSAYQKQRSELKGVVDAQNAAVAATQKQIDSLKLGTLSNLSPEQKYQEAQRQFDAAAEGDAKIAAGQALLQASQAFNGSSEAYSKDYAKVQAQLVLQVASQRAAASIAQQQLAALDTQIGKLVDIDSGIGTLNSTMVELQKAILTLGAAMSAQAVAAAAAGKPNKALADQGHAAITGVVENLYSTLLGRHSETEGLNFWTAAVESGQITYDQLVAGFTGSDEYKALNVTAHAKGGIADDWALVGEEGPEMVNFSEPGRVYTASETRSALSGGSSSEESAKPSRAIEQQNRLIEANNRLLERQNELLEALASGAATSDDIRGLKQSIVVAVSKKAVLT
ncbi:phage tail length tape measure family protein [Duganella sp. CT11-25]|uniref:phage tail length tape measure family protein n=1 Tax=unclassified Duganella TaxID=2636909 RepID=UPI0039B0DCA7